MAHLQQVEPSVNDVREMVDQPVRSLMTATPEVSERNDPPAQRIERVYRHALQARLGHWLNVVCLFILIMSGLQIFNAHPALYWGDRSDRDKPLLSICPMKTERGETRGSTTILGHQFDTTGVLGYSNGFGRAFPA